MKDTAKHKYATIGFIYLFGLICASFLSSIICFAASALLGAIFFIVLLRRGKFSIHVMFMALAFLSFGVYNEAYIDKSYALDGKTAYVTGTVTERKNSDNDIVFLEIKGEAEGLPVKFTLLTEDTGVGEGDKVELTALFSKFRDNRYFAEESYYYSKGVFLRAYAKGDIVIIEKGKAGFFTILSEYCKGIISSSFTNDEGGIIKAMLFGDKSDLSSELSVNIKRSGIAHLTAVSGMHLSLMAHTAVLVIQAFFRRKGKPSAIVSALFIIFLMMFFGMTVSVVRSGIMMLVFYGSFLFNRRSNILNSISAALLVILIANPCACRDIGLWLSVMGTVGVGVAAPKLLSCLKIRDNASVKALLIASLCANLCTAPIGMFCFGGVSLVSVFTSLFVQLFFTVILVLVPLALLLPFLSPPLLFAAGVSAGAIKIIADFLGGLTFSYINVERDAMAAFFAVTVVGITVLFLISRRRRSIKYFMAAALASFATALVLSEIIEYDNIKISVYSDGKNAIMKAEEKTGISVFALSDSTKTAEMIYEYTAGEKVNLICIAADTDNNSEIRPEDYSCTVHLPEMGNALYNISGEYTALVKDGEIILSVRGITAALLPIKSKTECDAAIYTGYSKSFEGCGNFATILCDKKFYNCEDAVNACYSKAEIIVNPEGGVVLKTD